MGQLQVITRRGVSPQGKPRVFFCCHAADHERYFEAVSKEILDKQNCAFYYYQPDVQPVEGEERALDLGQMQLFVMPVTTRLLTDGKGDNTALRDFDFAVAHHIPVLPLMQESGLEALFNQRCGDLQFLDKNAVDPTAIGYDEKLTKYLAGVLVGDELAEKVRAAFDAYVFLSYRKKDRKYAQELMRLIHKNDFCRDIAIWYDEFLTPGENWSDSIRDAMAQSSLFALVVTPNLVNEPNYVAAVEYPMARQEGKPILPVQLVPTKRMVLKRMYKGIKSPVDAYNEAALANALAAQTRCIATRENDSDPQHNFFIGLAYLGGIDVEVDHEKAVGLITSAADAGLPEAMEKLVGMYNTGEGLQRDYHKAVEWQARLVEHHRAVYERTGGPDACHTLRQACYTLGCFCYELRDLSAAQSAFEQAYALDRVRSSCVENRSGEASTAERLGAIARLCGNYAAAERYYQQSLALCKSYADETGSMQARTDLAICYSVLGQLAMDGGNLEAAQGYYLECFKLRKTLAEETGAATNRRDLSLSYSRLGDVAKARGQYEKALEYYTLSLELDKKLVEETDTVQSRRDLAVTYERLGNIAKARGEFESAWQYYSRVYELCKALAEETGTMQSRIDLAGSYVELGDIAKKRGDLETALLYHQQGYDLKKALMQEAGTVDMRRGFALSCERLGDIAKAGGDYETAAEWYSQSFDMVKALTGEAWTVYNRRNLAFGYDRQAELAEHRGDIAAAQAHYEQSFALRKALAEETDTVENREFFVISCNNLGQLSYDRGDFKAAADYYRKSVGLSKALAEETGTVQNRKVFAYVCDRMGVVLEKCGELERALLFHRKSAALREVLGQETGSVQICKDLRYSYEKAAICAYNLKDFVTAQKYFAAAEQLNKRLSDCEENKERIANNLRQAERQLAAQRQTQQE